MINWADLNHAYGAADNIKALVESLSEFPPEDSYEEEPWFTLWSSLYHQGDIYSASFAAVIEICKVLETSPERATPSFFSLPSSIEIARNKSSFGIPKALVDAYKKAINSLGKLASQALNSSQNSELARSALTMVAVSSGQYEYAELISEVPSDEVGEVLELYFDR